MSKLLRESARHGLLALTRQTKSLTARLHAVGTLSPAIETFEMNAEC